MVTRRGFLQGSVAAVSALAAAGELGQAGVRR